MERGIDKPMSEVSQVLLVVRVCGQEWQLSGGGGVGGGGGSWSEVGKEYYTRGPNK